MVARDGYIDVEGGRVWYRIEGDGTGTPLLTLHGGPGISHDYLAAPRGPRRRAARRVLRPARRRKIRPARRPVALDRRAVRARSPAGARRTRDSIKSTSSVSHGARCWGRLCADRCARHPQPDARESLPQRDPLGTGCRHAHRRTAGQGARASSRSTERLRRTTIRSSRQALATFSIAAICIGATPGRRVCHRRASA